MNTDFRLEQVYISRGELFDLLQTVERLKLEVRELDGEVTVYKQLFEREKLRTQTVSKQR